MVTALRESGGSSARYQALISQLSALETALIHVKELDLDGAQHSQVVALRQAAAQCTSTIEGFLEKIRKYQPSLGGGGSEQTVKDVWRKFQWAIWEEESIVRFRADLMAHTESIELLLLTIEM